MQSIVMKREKGRFWTRYDKVQQAEPTGSVSNLDGSLYAVLFNANEGRHSRDLRLVYHSLIDAGVSDVDISVLEGDGITKNRFVNRSATILNLESTVDSIRQEVTANDRLLVYVTNHGNLVNGQCKLAAYDGTIWEKDFEKMMQDLPVNFGLFYFAQCSSGGFAERMGYGRNIGMSNAARGEISYGNDGIGAQFTHWLFPRILGEDVVIEKAFDKSIMRDTCWGIDPINFFLKETPQLRWQNADPSQLCLNPTFVLKR